MVDFRFEKNFKKILEEMHIFEGIFLHGGIGWGNFIAFFNKHIFDLSPFKENDGGFAFEKQYCGENRRLGKI